MIYLILLIMLISLLCLLWTTYFKPKSWARIPAKLLCSFCFVCIVIVALVRLESITKYMIFLFVGFIFCMIGDGCLGYADKNFTDDSPFFTAGVFAFSLAHIFYIIAFVFIGEMPSLLFLLIPIIATILFYPITKLRIFDFQGFDKLVLIYFFIIITMLVVGCYNNIPIINNSNIYVLLGIILFVLSDTILMFFYFLHTKYKILSVINLTLYFLSQIFLSISLLMQPM